MGAPATVERRPVGVGCFPYELAYFEISTTSPKPARRRVRCAREVPVPETVRETITQLLESTRQMCDQLLSLPTEEVGLPSSHVCAQGGDLWRLLTNDIDHELIHTGQVLEGRYEARAKASPMERLVAEWIVARARFVASFVGMSDAAFNEESAPGQWSYPAIAKHIYELEQHSLKTIREDIAGR